jgi:hypothetical protein
MSTEFKAESFYSVLITHHFFPVTVHGYFFPCAIFVASGSLRSLSIE